MKEQFQILLSNRFSALDSIADADSLYGEVTNALMDAAKESSPIQRQPTKCFISDETLELVDERRQAKAQSRSRFNYLTREIKRQLRKDEEMHWNKLSDDLERSAKLNNITRLFRIINKVTGAKSVISGQHGNKNGQIIETMYDKLNRWREHFDELYNRPPPVETDVNLLTAEMRLRNKI